MSRSVMIDRIMSIIMLIIIGVGGAPILAILGSTGGVFWFLLGLVIFGAAEVGMALTLHDSFHPVRED